MALQQDIDKAVSLLPEDGSEIPYEEFRQNVITAGVGDANGALSWLMTKNGMKRRMTIGEDKKPQMLVSRL